MTTDIAQTEEKPSQRPPLPPVEMESAPHALVEEHVAVAPAVDVSHNQNISAGAATAPQAAPAADAPGIAGWLSRNRWFTKEPVTYTAYQFVRSTIAAVPYAFGMAAGHHAFGLMSAKGQKMGLTEDGIAEFNKGGVLGLERTVAGAVQQAESLKAGLGVAEKEAAAVLARGKYFESGLNGSIGRGMMRLGNSPLNAAVQIAMGFTMFRFTGGVIKNLRDRVMNDKNTPEQTIAEVKHAPKTIVETMKINWPAESVGTPIAALVLGFMNAAYTPVVKLVRNKDMRFIDQVGEVLAPKNKLLQNAGVWTASYSLFFLLAESLFKDKQIQRGHWKGHPNSLKNGPDDTVGGPGAVSFKPPGSHSDYAPQPVGSAEEGYKQDDDRAKDSHEKLRFPGLTGEPSIGRFMIRRVLPVAVGISAYAALKRVGYLADIPLPGVKGLTGPMEPMTVPVVKELKTVGDHSKFFLKNAWREGKATAMFGALWVATDAWGTFYDKFVHNLQKPENAVPLNEHQQEKHAELLARLNAKVQSQGRAA